MAVDELPIEERANRLIDRLREQESRAADALVRAHYDRIHRYLARLLGDAAAAEDLTQDTFLRAYEALPRLADDANLSGWLFRIATNLARKHYRRRRLVCWTRLPCGETPHYAPPTRALEEDVAAQDEVRRALDQLPLDQRACLLLYAWTGYTCPEIGQIMGRSADAARMLLVRARRRFRHAYAEGIVAGGRHDPAAAADGNAAGGADPLRPRKGDKGAKEGRAATGATGRVPAVCERIQEALPRYPRADLPRDTFSAVTRHVRDCSRCRAALLDVQATYRLLQAYLNTARPAGPQRRDSLLVRFEVLAVVRVAVPEVRSEAPIRVRSPM